MQSNDMTCSLTLDRFLLPCSASPIRICHAVALSLSSAFRTSLPSLPFFCLFSAPYSLTLKSLEPVKVRLFDVHARGVRRHDLRCAVNPLPVLPVKGVPWRGRTSLSAMNTGFLLNRQQIHNASRPRFSKKGGEGDMVQIPILPTTHHVSQLSASKKHQESGNAGGYS